MTDRTNMSLVAAAADLAEEKFGDLHWILGKGRCTEEEPMFGFAVFHPEDTDNPIVETEHDNPLNCVWSAVCELEMTERH